MAEANIHAGWGRCTPPILVGRAARSRGEGRGCVILTEEGGEDYHSTGLCLGLGAGVRKGSRSRVP